jgi:hypothetical protein
MAMAERSGESANDASDTVTNGTQCEQDGKKFGEKDSTQSARKADSEARNAKASSGDKSSEAGASGKSCSGSARAGVVQAVQERVGSNRGAHSERARYALRMPLLPEVAPSTWSGAWI